MEEEKKKTSKKTSSSSVKKVGEKPTTKSTKQTTAKKTTKKESPEKKSTQATKKTTKKVTTKEAKTPTTKKAKTSKASSPSTTKKKSTTSKTKNVTSQNVTTKKSTTTKSPAKKASSKESSKKVTKKNSTKKTSSKTKKPVEKKIAQEETVTTIESTNEELLKLNEIPKEEPKSLAATAVEEAKITEEIKPIDENKPVEESKPPEETKTTDDTKPAEESTPTEEDLIITRQLDINLDDYTYNQEGLVEKVKSILEEENKNLEDPLKDEELFTDIFNDNKNLYRKIKKKLKNLKKKAVDKKKSRPEKEIPKVEPKETAKPHPTRENKYKDIVASKQQELEEKERLRKERLARRYLSFDTESQPKPRPKPQPRIKKGPRKKPSKSFPVLIFFLLITLILCLVCINIYNNPPTINFTKKPSAEEIAQEKERERQKQLLKDYNTCLNTPNSEEEHLEELTTKINETTEYIKNNYKTSIKYEDLTYGFTYAYNEEPSYYAASTIKLVDALYLYNKAAKGEVNLDDTIIFTKKYKANASKYMSTLSYGSKVSLRTLIKYAIEVSDNSAHLMLIDYIGYNNLKEYGKSLGATYTLSGTDKFGYISVNDALIYLKTLNEFINNNGELGRELQSYLLNAEQNDLALPDLNIQAAHKYGEYGSVYHDIGIVYDSHPYTIAILTNEGQSKNFENKVKDINKHIYELHQAFYTNHEQVCHQQVYGSE